MKTLTKILGIAALALCVASASAQGFIKSVNTLAALKLIQPDSNYPYVLVLGWASAADGGGGLYKIATQSASTNYGVVASTIDSTKQWVRMPGLADFGKPARTQTLTAASTIAAESETVKITGTGGATVLTNNQVLASGVDGQRLTIVGGSDTDTVAISDKAGLTAGGTIQLTTTNIVLGIDDYVVLKYNGATTNWHEISRGLN